jgi:hypothetical protein
MELNLREKRANIVALGGIIAAMSLVLMLLSRLIPFTEMALPALAGVLLISAVLEAGAGWAFVMYIAVGLLSLFFALSNGAALYYILFFGHYTIIKSFVERIPNKPLQWVVKLLIFNVCAVAVYFMMTVFVGLPEKLFNYGMPVLLVLINAVFILYDIALSRLIVTYFHRIRKIIRRA